MSSLAPGSRGAVGSRATQKEAPQGASREASEQVTRRRSPGLLAQPYAQSWARATIWRKEAIWTGKLNPG